MALHRRALLPLLLTALVSMSAALLPGASAEACSCGRAPDWGFLLEPEVKTLPDNAQGVLWWTLGGGEPRKEEFTVARVVEGKEEAVGFSFVAIGDGVYLVKPAADLKPGEVWRFGTTRASHNGLPVFTGKGVEPHVRELTITREVLTLKGGDARLEVKARAQGSLRVAMGASCTGEVESAAADLKVGLPAGAEGFKGHLFFTTLVDGKPWHAKESLCQIVPPGRTWRAPGEDTLHASCDSYNTGLEPGKHSVQVQVLSPITGEKAIVTQAVEIELRCDPDKKPTRSGGVRFNPGGLR